MPCYVLESHAASAVSPESAGVCLHGTVRHQQGHWDALQQVEGEEADKVLAFFPRDVKPNNQSAVVGLVQAMLAFSSIFSQVRSQAVACQWAGLTL